MIRSYCILAIVFGLVTPAAAQDVQLPYSFSERTRDLAFDPARFFPERAQAALSIRYLGDDYGFPVYAIAVRKGCTDADEGVARQTCGGRLTARMVRSPYKGDPVRPRARGRLLMTSLGQPRNDEDLTRALDAAGLEWLEADVRECPSAMAHLATVRELKFSPSIDLADQPFEFVLHADKISFEVGDYLMRSRYDGWLKPGSPAEWANEFAASLDACWKPSAALVPWRVTKDELATGDVRD